jgi:ribonuclease HI
MKLSPLALKLFNQLAANKTIIAACDAGTIGNGKPTCIASYGVTILHHDSIDTLIKFAEEWKQEVSAGGKGKSTQDDSIELYNYNGLVSKNIVEDGLARLKELGLSSYKRSDGTTAVLKIFNAAEMTPTVNRGELTAINVLLDKISDECLDGDVVILSDSQYTLNTVDTWSRGWFKDPAKNILCEKENLDLVASAQLKLDNLRKTRKVTLEHIRSHKKYPNIDTDPFDWLKWYMNHRADMVAGVALPR